MLKSAGVGLFLISCMASSLTVASSLPSVSTESATSRVAAAERNHPAADLARAGRGQKATTLRMAIRNCSGCSTIGGSGHEKT